MKTIRAVYENGTFKPVEPLSLANGTSVEISLPESTDELSKDLRARFPNSFGVMPAEDADEIMRIIADGRKDVDVDNPFPESLKDDI